MTLTRALLHPLSPVAAQAVGHGVNLLSQLALLHAFGAEVYGDLGLGLLVVSTLAFLGELGMPAFLMRLAATDTNWPEAWRVVAFHRLLAIGLLIGGAILFWGLWRGFGSQGSLLLLAAAPGLLLSACNLSPILYGLDQPRRAALASHIRWITYGVLALLIAFAALPSQAGLLLGFASSIGWMVQHGVLRKSATLPPDLRPRRGSLRADMRQGAIGLTSLGILALLHARALPFLLAAQAPHLLAPCLLALQVLQGLGSLLGQTDRLLLPALLKNADLTPLRLLVHLTGGLAALLLLAHATWSLFFPGPLDQLAGWMILEWSFVQLGFAGYLGTLAQQRERVMLIRQSAFLLLCLALQAIASVMPPPTDLLLAGRALASAALAGLAILPLANAPVAGFARTGALAGICCLAALRCPPALAMLLALLWGVYEVRAFLKSGR